MIWPTDLRTETGPRSSPRLRASGSGVQSSPKEREMAGTALALERTRTCTCTPMCGSGTGIGYRYRPIQFQSHFAVALTEGQLFAKLMWWCYWPIQPAGGTLVVVYCSLAEVPTPISILLKKKKTPISIFSLNFSTGRIEYKWILYVN